MLTETADLLALAMALAVGLILGIERGWSGRTEPEGGRAAGLRTFAVAALAGGICTRVPGGLWGLLVVTAAIAALMTAAYALQAERRQDFGITTSLTLVITPLLGALAAQQPLEGIATAAVIAGLLSFKQELHDWLARLARAELLASVQLLIVAVVLLPILPVEIAGPWGPLSPRAIGWLVLLVLGISFIGYVLVRVTGTRSGLLLTALLGGLVSSTAVTVAYARISAEARDGARVLGAGVALACAIMAPRVAVEVGVVAPALLDRLWLPLGLLALVPLVYAGLAARAGGAAAPAGGPVLRNPLAIGAALILAAGVTLLTLGVQAGQAWFGEGAVYALAALSGTVDVDAIAVSLAQQSLVGLPGEVASRGIVIALIVNSLVKAALIALLAAPVIRWRCAAALAGGGLAALAALPFS